MWEPHPKPYSVSVSNPQKKSKFKGIKSFIAYEIVTSVSTAGNYCLLRQSHECVIHDNT